MTRTITELIRLIRYQDYFITVVITTLKGFLASGSYEWDVADNLKGIVERTKRKFPDTEIVLQELYSSGGLYNMGLGGHYGILMRKTAS